MTSVTVGVTVRNDRAGLRILLDALAKQTRAPDEVIIVDAASSDGTREEAEAFAKTAPFPVRVESFPCTRGAGRARIVELAQGDLVAFTDADCAPPPDWLARYAAAWQGEAALGGPNFSPEGASPLQRAVEDVMAHTEAASFHGVNTCNALYSRAALLRAGNFADMQVAEDPDVNARLAAQGGVLRRIDNPVHQRRRATWRALVLQHYEYGKGAWALLQRHPGYFPAVEAWVGALLGALVLAGLLLAPFQAAWLLLALGALVLPPLVVHRRMARAFLQEHGLSVAFWRRLGVLWVVYAPYHAGLLVARLSSSRPTIRDPERP